MTLVRQEKIGIALLLENGKNYQSWRTAVLHFTNAKAALEFFQAGGNVQLKGLDKQRADRFQRLRLKNAKAIAVKQEDAEQLQSSDDDLPSEVNQAPLHSNEKIPTQQLSGGWQLSGG